MIFDFQPDHKDKLISPTLFSSIILTHSMLLPPNVLLCCTIIASYLFPLLYNGLSKLRPESWFCKISKIKNWSPVECFSSMQHAYNFMGVPPSPNERIRIFLFRSKTAQNFSTWCHFFHVKIFMKNFIQKNEVKLKIFAAC